MYVIIKKKEKVNQMIHSCCDSLPNGRLAIWSIRGVFPVSALQSNQCTKEKINSNPCSGLGDQFVLGHDSPAFTRVKCLFKNVWDAEKTLNVIFICYLVLNLYSC